MERGLRRIGIVVLVVIAGLVPARALAGPLDPTGFASLGALSLTSGSGTIDTTGASPTLTVGSSTYTGVVYQGVAVFDFSSVVIGAGVTLSDPKGGGLPVALLSQSTMSIAGRINVSAFAATSGPAGAGGSEGGNGTSKTDFTGSIGSSGGGGGGFGGAGGAGGSLFFAGQTIAGGAGGLAVADLADVLSGGAAGGSIGFGSGGGGGGGIELGASQGLTISGEVDAIGGDASYTGGGGGSGGGIFLHANSVSIAGTLDVQGGAGTPGNYAGRSMYATSGGGGGGEILVEYGSSLSTVGADIIKTGGTGANNAASGQFIMQAAPFAAVVPEPSSLVLCGTSALGLLGLALARRRGAGRRGP